MELRCLVKPQSKIDKIQVELDGTLRIKIRALPVAGKANQYLITYLASVFDVYKGSIQIISGFTNSHKRINIVADETKIINKLKTL